MDPLPAAVNVRSRTVDARADGSPITAGTVNYYLVALTGDNAGKWFRDSDDSWQAAEAICGAMTHKADGHWTVSVAAAAWIDGVEYMEYAKESGDLHVPVSAMIRSQSVALAGGEMDLVNAPNSTAITAIQNGLSTFDGTGGTLHSDYNAAKSAAQEGDTMKVSAGSGAGQLDFTSGVVKSNLSQILGSALTGTAAYFAAAFKKLFNVATPVLVASDVMRGTDSANTTVPDAAGVAAGLHGTTDGLIGALVVPDAAGVAAGLHGTTDGKVDAVQTDATAIKAKTDGLNFTGDDVKATLDGEEAVTDAASRTASKADVSGVSTHAAADVVTALFANASMKEMLAFARGKVVIAGSDITFYDTDDTTPLYTLTLAVGGRTVA